MRDPIDQAYQLLFNARNYNKQTYGTLQENEEIRQMISVALMKLRCENSAV